MTYDGLIREMLRFVENEQTRKDILSHKYGVGGIHWCCGAGVYRDVVDIDAKSFYPHILLNWHLLPDWIDEGKYKELLDRRMAGDKDERLKAALNVPTGKLRMPQSSALDKERGLTMCMMGQILISILREKLEKDYEIIQVNTDGIMARKKKDNINVESINDLKEFRKINLLNIISDWQSIANIPVSIKDIELLEQKDVNNYRATYVDGSVKLKGAKYIVKNN